MVHWVGTTPASMWANIADYGVRNDGLLYQLHSNTDLTLITPTNALVADFGYVKGFGMRSDGNAYLWNDGNNVLLNTPQRNYDFGQSYGTIIGFNGRSDGTAYLEMANGHVIRNTLARNIDLTTGSDGKVYDIAADGSLVRATPGVWDWTAVPASAIRATGTRSDGCQYLWLTTGDLFLRTPPSMTGPDAWVVAGFGHMKGFGMRSDGNAYLWNDGNNVLLNTPTQNIDFGKVYGTIIGFNMRSDGTAYLEMANGHVFRNTLTRNIDLSAGSDGKVYDMAADGTFVRATPGTWDWAAVPASAIQATGTRSDGCQYLWLTTGDLFLRTPPSMTGPDAWVVAGFGPVKGFAMRPDGNAYLLQNGNLTVNTPTANVPVASSVSSFALDRAGKAYFLQTNGYLWHEGAPRNPLTDAGEIASSVTSFALDRAGKAYFLQTNGYLWHEGAPTYVANGVSSFKLDPAGKAYYLQTNGNLYHEGQGLVDVRAYAINLGADGSLVLDDWFSRNLSDGGLQTLARQDVMNRGVLTRQDLVGAGGIIARVEADGVVTAAERGGLLALSAGGATLGETAAVNYQLDIVARGAAAGGTAPLQSLVNRWFFGTDHPALYFDPALFPKGAPAGVRWTPFGLDAAGRPAPLWSSFISYMDVNQRALGDCTFLAAFAAVAYRAPDHPGQRLHRQRRRDLRRPPLPQRPGRLRDGR